jgi:hypothetical protein
LVSPITAALLAPYAARPATPVMLEATEATLMIEPERRSSMAGSAALMVWNIEVTF